MAREASTPLVLVVEDERLLRMDAVDMIKKSGFESCTFSPNRIFG
jgi:hypothetical protein